MAQRHPPLRLTAFEFRERMPGGSSRPMLLACEDETGNEVIVVAKLREIAATGVPNRGPAGLACELVCAVLARAAGLAVPNYAIVEVGEEFAASVRDTEAREELLRNVGENFGSVYQEDCSNFLPEMRMGDAGRLGLESVLALDAFVLNPDRTAAKPNLIFRGETVYLIDHALCFPHLGSLHVGEP
jgi:hypothetical protein